MNTRTCQRKSCLYSRKLFGIIDLIYFNLPFRWCSTNQTYLAFDQLKELPNLAFSESFDRNLPTAIYIHGWQDNGKFDTSCTAIRDAYLERGGYNVITIDWSAYSKNFYYHLTVVPQLKVIAEIIAERLLRLDENGYSINNIHLVGHSLGYSFSYGHQHFNCLNLL